MASRKLASNPSSSVEDEKKVGTNKGVSQMKNPYRKQTGGTTTTTTSTTTTTAGGGGIRFDRFPSAGCKGRIPVLPAAARRDPETDSDSDEEEEEETVPQQRNPFAMLEESKVKKIISKKELRGESPNPPGEGGPGSGSKDQQKKKGPKVNPQKFDFIMVLDFEATCERNDSTFPHEIIEFPVVVVDTARLSVCGQFHSYVRPQRFQGKLSTFCTELTGITQDLVDAAPTLPEVVEQFNTWFAANVPQGAKCIFATDGPWDLRNFMCRHSVVRDGITFPRIFYSYLDVRHCFADHMHCKPRGVQAMLAKLGMTFEGREHSGIDDTKNIARILIAMCKRGYIWANPVKVNEERVRTEVENEETARRISAEGRAPLRGSNTGGKNKKGSNNSNKTAVEPLSDISDSEEAAILEALGGKRGGSGGGRGGRGGKTPGRGGRGGGSSGGKTKKQSRLQ